MTELYNQISKDLQKAENDRLDRQGRSQTRTNKSSERMLKAVYDNMLLQMLELREILNRMD